MNLKVTFSMGFVRISTYVRKKLAIRKLQLGLVKFDIKKFLNSALSLILMNAILEFLNDSGGTFLVSPIFFFCSDLFLTHTHTYIERDKKFRKIMH